MVYRDATIVGINDLHPHEQLAFGALIRIALGAESAVGPAHQEVLDQLASELGTDDFWAMIDEAGEALRGPEHAHELATKVKRRTAQELIYAAVAELAMAGSITPDEMAVLEELRRLWGLEERRVSSAYRDG